MNKEKMPRQVDEKGWQYIVNKDKLPKNWEELLKNTGLKAAVSPLHDGDISLIGKKEEPHYHIIVCWDSLTTYSEIGRIGAMLNAEAPIAVHSVPGAYYGSLLNGQNPNKPQYSEEDIVTVNGFNIDKFSRKKKGEVKTDEL